MFKSIISPKRTIDIYLASNTPIGRSCRGLLLTGLLYVFSSFVLGVAGAVPYTPCFIPFSQENYYFWQMIFLLPFVFGLWFLAGGVIYFFTGRKKHVSATRIMTAISIPIMTSFKIAWLPAAVEAFFMSLGMSQEEYVEILSVPGLWQGILIGIYLLAAFFLASTMVVAVRKSAKVSLRSSVVSGMIAAVAIIAGYMLFIR